MGNKPKTPAEPTTPAENAGETIPTPPATKPKAPDAKPTPPESNPTPPGNESE